MAPGTWQRLQGALYRFGILGICPLIVRRAREWLRHRRAFCLQRDDEVFDRDHGVDTCRMVALSRLSIDSAWKQFAGDYGATPLGIFRTMMKRLWIDYSRYAFMDLGCGKGKTLLVAAEHGFNRVIGVDFSQELCAIARANVNEFCRTHANSNIEVICADATSVQPPAGNCVLYFCNPFGEPLMQQVIQNIGRSLSEQPRDVFIVYCNPQWRQVCDSAGFLKKHATSLWSPEWYIIYRAVRHHQGFKADTSVASCGTTR